MTEAEANQLASEIDEDIVKKRHVRIKDKNPRFYVKHVCVMGMRWV